uniref:Secreted protein n=1 Tax=uncultured organism TaxID=155900 RepID=M1PPS2_9ZZZZ|nr:secreted protein [uncultured organism]
MEVMKTKLESGTLLVLGILLVSSFPIVAENSEKDYTFRRTRWGMSRSEVISREGMPDKVERLGSGGYGRALYFTDVEVAGIKAMIFFFFTENKLTKSGYIFTETYNDKNNHIDNFKKVRSIVSDKYSPPEVDEKKWSDDLFKGYPDKYGFAVAKGHLSYKAIWRTPRSKIFLILRGKKNGSYSHDTLLQ